MRALRWLDDDAVGSGRGALLRDADGSVLTVLHLLPGEAVAVRGFCRLRVHRGAVRVLGATVGVHDGARELHCPRDMGAMPPIEALEYVSGETERDGTAAAAPLARPPWEQRGSGLGRVAAGLWDGEKGGALLSLENLAQPLRGGLTELRVSATPRGAAS